jgi:hypothetical protein
MANITKGLLTTYGSTSQVESNYFFVISGTGYVPRYTTSSYIFIGRVEPWINENDPDSPTQNQIVLKNTFKNIIAAKLLTSSNMCPVVRRIDWTANTVYQYYKDYEDMFTVDENKIITKKFYVKNRYDQIFKCLWNNNGGQSTVEPILQPGSTEPSQTLYLNDGYKWIYVATLDKGLKKDFFDDDWMPLPATQKGGDILRAEKFGTINAINVINSGNNYANGPDTTIVNISGDGTGATAYANVVNSRVQDIIVTNTGNNYSYASATISLPAGFTGSNAIAIPIVSSVGGHGSDPISELGCNHIMISADIKGSEGGLVPTDINFRQVGIIVNPQLKDGKVPTRDVYNTTDLAYVSFGVGSYNSGEIIYQGNQNSPSFSARVCSFDSSNNIVSLINIKGDPVLYAPIYGANSGTSRVLTQYEPTEFAIGSGYMVYYENRTPVQRSSTGNEQLRLVLSF